MTKSPHGWVRPDLDARLSAHERAWQKSKHADSPRSPEFHQFITISRQYGCEGAALAHRLVDILNERCRPSFAWVAYDHELLSKISTDSRLRSNVVGTLDSRRHERMDKLFDSILNRKASDASEMRQLADVVRTLATLGRAVLLGRGSYLITQDLKTGLHVKLIAPLDWRALHVAATREVTHGEAKKIITDGERRREQYLRKHFVEHPEHVVNPDLVIDNSRFNLVQIGEIVFTALSTRLGKMLVRS
jgi:cytidylate kinase